MCSNTSNNDLNREYIYVRRLISVLTNDDSDKLIVEKLKGKNLSSLLYNAKIIDNNKNMTANKKILACVIRAIEREKHLCHKSELEQSWGRKFLNSFNCLYPGLKENENHTEHSVFGSTRERKFPHKPLKHTLSRRTKTSSTRTPKAGCRNGFKNRCGSSMTCAKTANETGKHQFRDKPNSYVESFRNSCVESIMTDRFEDKDDDLSSERWKRCQQVTLSCVFKTQKMAHETIRPPLLQQRKLQCVMIYPGRPLPAIKRIEKADKKCSSTQTSDISYVPDPLVANLPNNIKLQDLLEAASNLINTEAHREYVRSFLQNYEPPFDLSAGFPPYLKLPMEESYVTGQESVYGTNSELSLRSDYLRPGRQSLTVNDVVRQKEENVRKYVRDIEMSDPWQDTAESVISGVINESLPHDKADYSQLGACILKKLGAYPETPVKDTRNHKQNLSIPEIILQCTEFFESGGGDSDKKPESNTRNVEPESVKDSNIDKSPSIVEINLMEAAKPRDDQRIQNYCFLDSDYQKANLYNLSERSLVGLGNCQDNCKEPCKNELQGQGDGSQDRKNLQLREPLKITPSGLEQGGKKTNKASIFGRRGKAKTAEPKRVPTTINNIQQLNTEDKGVANRGTPARQKVSIYTVSSAKNEEPPKKFSDSLDDSEAIEIIPTLNLSALGQPAPDPNVIDIDNGDNLETQSQEIIETETPPPELAQPRWEPAEVEAETFEGVGEDRGKPTSEPVSKSDRKQPPTKNCTSREKIRGKKKCKVVSKKKAHTGKNDDPSRNCRVM